MPRLILAVSCLGLLASACVAPGNPQELSTEQACLQHYEHDPIGRDRCRLPPENQSGSVPDVRPQDLPIHVDGPGDRG